MSNIDEPEAATNLKNFAIFTRKKLLLQSLFNKVAGLQTCNFITKRLQHRCFPVNIVKFLRKPILKNNLRTADSGEPPKKWKKENKKNKNRNEEKS